MGMICSAYTDGTKCHERPTWTASCGSFKACYCDNHAQPLRDFAECVPGLTVEPFSKAARLEAYLALIERDRAGRPSEAMLADEIKRLRPLADILTSERDRYMGKAVLAEHHNKNLHKIIGAMAQTIAATAMPDDPAEIERRLQDLRAATSGTADTTDSPVACAMCRQPARGFATINDDHYCHGDYDQRPTCYERAQLRIAAGIWPAEGEG